MTDLRKAAEQALEAFEKIYEGCGEVKKDNLSKQSNELATLVRKDCIPQIEALRQALAQPKQEPVGYVTDSGKSAYILLGVDLEDDTPLYTAPPKREWVGLSDEDLEPMCDDWRIIFGPYVHDFSKAIEAKLKEKNGG